MTPLRRLKVTLQGHVIYPSVCVHSISPEPFSLNFTQMFLCEAVCRTNDSATQTRVQGHTSRSWDLPLNFISFKSPQPFVRFSLNITQMFLCELVCRTHDSAMQTQSHFKVMGFCDGGIWLPFRLLVQIRFICRKTWPPVGGASFPIKL